MHITKCDICKKEINREKSAKIRIVLEGASLSSFNSFEICEKCSKPITKFLKDKKLIKEDKKNGRKK
jgi:hypothetical protein